MYFHEGTQANIS